METNKLDEMNENKSKTNNSEIVADKNEEWKAEFIEVSKSLATNLSKIFSSLLAFSSLLYFIGWVYTKSYFQKFGANWIPGSLPVQSIFSYAWIPGSYLCAAIVYSMTGFLERKLPPKKLPFLVRHFGKATIFLLVITCANQLFVTRFKNQAESMIWFASACFFLVFAAAMLNHIILASKKSEKFDHSIAIAIFGVLFMALYLYPNNMGRSDGITDSNYEESKLPKCFLKDDSTAKCLVLHSTGSLNYIAIYNDSLKLINLRMLENENILIKPTR